MVVAGELGLDHCGRPILYRLVTFVHAWLETFTHLEGKENELKICERRLSGVAPGRGPVMAQLYTWFTRLCDYLNLCAFNLIW